MVIGPLVVAASLLVPPPEPQAVSTRAPARAAAAVYLEGRVRRGRFIAGPSLFGVELLMAVSAWWFGGVTSGGHSGTRAPARWLSARACVDGAGGGAGDELCCGQKYVGDGLALGAGEQGGRRRLAPAINVRVHRGQRRRQIGGDLAVVKPDYRQVIRYQRPALPG